MGYVRAAEAGCSRSAVRWPATTAVQLPVGLAPWPIPRDALVAGSLLERADLLELLDRAVTRRVTVISAPPGSGKTSLLRAWAGLAPEPRSRRLWRWPSSAAPAGALGSWSTVVDALHGPASAVMDPDAQPAPASCCARGRLQVVDRLLTRRSSSAAGAVLLIIDDLHELRSADALGQLRARALDAAAELRTRSVLSSRRDPASQAAPAQGFAEEVAEIRAGDLRFTRARDARAAGCVRDRSVRRWRGRLARASTEGWAAGLSPGRDLAPALTRIERFVAEFSRPTTTGRSVEVPDGRKMLERQPSDVQSMLLLDLARRPDERRAAPTCSRAPPTPEQMLLDAGGSQRVTVTRLPRPSGAPGFDTTHHLLADFLRLELLPHVGR